MTTHRVFVYDPGLASRLGLHDGTPALYPPGHSRMVVAGHAAPRPGLLPDRHGKAVRGEVYTLSRPSLKGLDNYLSPVYHRRKVRVMSPSGAEARAWAYFLTNADTWSLRPSVGGDPYDWRAHQTARLKPYLDVLAALRDPKPVTPPPPAELDLTDDDPKKKATREAYAAFIRKIRAIGEGGVWAGMTPSGLFGKYTRNNGKLYLVSLVDEHGIERMKQPYEVKETNDNA
jgi:gamma-glutamylcyclotransferase (GGCT)/AIG2-like uncharacterized protein YtfP